MDERWSYARKLYDDAFAPLVAAGYRLDRIDGDEHYWELHERELRGDFPPEVFFNLTQLRSERDKSNLARATETRADHRLRDFCAVYDGDTLAAMFCGHQRDRATYRMWHTNVASDYRRRGIYKLILAGTIAYTKQMGFETIVSEHAPGNNPVLLAKLGAGFRIAGMDIQPMVGVSVLLTYFHHADDLALYDYRIGLATMNRRLTGVGFGAFDQLKQQFAETNTGGDDPAREQ